MQTDASEQTARRHRHPSPKQPIRDGAEPRAANLPPDRLPHPCFSQQRLIYFPNHKPNSVRQLLALFFCSLVSYAVHGQTFTDDLRNVDNNGGSLEVVQSTDMDTLVNEKELGKAATATGKAGPARYKRTKLKPGQTPTERVSGFRIQIYQVTGAEGNANAKKMQTRARQAFPGISTYVSLNGPRWVCRIGDFQTNEEAQIFLRRVRSSGISKTVSIVRSSIFVTY